MGSASRAQNLINGTRHNIYKDLHDPATLARMGAMQGVSMLLGPFGFGITAYEFIHRTAATVAGFGDRGAGAGTDRADPQGAGGRAGRQGPAVRAAAAKALVDYHDKATAMAIYELLADANSRCG